MSEPTKRTLVISPDIQVVVRDDCPPNTAYLVDPEAIVQQDLRTGELKHPFAAVKITHLESGDPS
jgi:hypothetical protein